MMIDQSDNSSLNNFNSNKTLPPAQKHNHNRNKKKTYKNNNKKDNIHTTSTPFRIATLNVRGLNEKTKQILLIDLIKDNDLQILGVSETNLNEKSSKQIYNRNRNYNAYFAADDNQ